MKDNSIKIISILLISLFVLFGFQIVSNADAGSMISSFTPNTDSSAASKVNVIGQNVVGVIQVVGIAIAVGMLLVLGIKYLRAAPDEKANIKQSSVIYIVGAVVLFAAVNIVKIVYTFATETVTC